MDNYSIYCHTHGKAHMVGCRECGELLDQRVQYGNEVEKCIVKTHEDRIKTLEEQVKQLEGLLALKEKHLDEAFDRIEDFREAIHLLAKHY